MDALTTLLYTFLHFLLSALGLIIGFFISLLQLVLEFARTIVEQV